MKAKLIVTVMILSCLLSAFPRSRGLPDEYFFTIHMITTDTRLPTCETLSLKEQPFIMAAKSLGAGNLRVMFKHILPNCMASIIVVFTLNIAIAILLESALAFLGFGDPTFPSWGLQLGRGRAYLATAWWLTTFPGLVVFLAVLSFNLVGGGLRDSLDPRLRGKFLT